MFVLHHCRHRTGGDAGLFITCLKHIYTSEYLSNPSVKTLSKHAYVRGYTSGTNGMPMPSRVLPLVPMVAPQAPMVPILPTIDC